MTHENLKKLMMEFRILLSTKKKGLDNIFKKLVASNGISKETGRPLKPVWARPCIMYGL